MNLHGGLGAGPSSLPPGGVIWRYHVRPRFRAFLENLKITEDQANDGKTEHRGVVSCLNRGYWNGSDDGLHRILIGS